MVNQEPNMSTLQRIMELQAKAEHSSLSQAEQDELYALETKWKNANIDPRECPSKPR